MGEAIARPAVVCTMNVCYVHRGANVSERDSTGGAAVI
jgi:hypothetical protein